jgi:hypothetical protein
VTAGVKGTKGAMCNLTLPTEIAERVDRTATRLYVTRQEYIRRFLIDNIDIIDPQTDAT